MKILIADDDFTSRVLLQELLSDFGEVQTGVTGTEAVELFRRALNAGKPFQFVCLDIMMPEESGLEALARIRALEEAVGIRGLDRSRILMITALDDSRTIMTAFREMCDGFVVKPLDPHALFRQMADLGLTTAVPTPVR